MSKEFLIVAISSVIIFMSVILIMIHFMGNWSNVVICQSRISDIQDINKWKAEYKKCEDWGSK